MIHKIPPVTLEPTMVMTHWRLFQLRGPSGRRSRHLVGRADDEGRVCSSLARLDIISLTAVSWSGRHYTLCGPPGFDPDAEYVFTAWLQFTKASNAKDMTRALQKLRRLRGAERPADKATIS